MDELIAVTLGSLAGSMVGAFSLMKWLIRREVSKAVLPTWGNVTITTSSNTDSGAHVHRFDTMVGDGNGWRCGICGALKGQE